jgi:hypothetical protein
MNVETVTPREWDKDGEKVVTYWVKLTDREKDVPCYQASILDLKLGEPLPEGWEIRQSKAGKDYLAPPRKPGSGSGSGRREMSPSERAEIRAEVALKAAVEFFGDRAAVQTNLAGVLRVADEMYEWISKFSAGAPASSLSPSGSAGGTSSPPPRAQNPPATTSGPNEGQPEDGGGATAVGTGEGSAAAPPSLQPGEVLGKPCPDCGCEVWKDAPMKGWSICTACGTAEKTKEVTLP